MSTILAHPGEVASPPERHIGLLFIHGIGEQKRFEHLLETAADLAELMLQANPHATLTTLDRTADWKLPAGVVDPAGTVPLTMTMTFANGTRTVFSCREAWWADLGARSGLFDTITFWLWALGQWATPIYRLLDAARTSDKAIDEPPITRLPKSVVGTSSEWRARMLLAVVALCALMVSLSWVLAKRMFSKLAGTTASPTLIVQYVGDVHTYEERAAPGNTNLSDPGFPRRVAIRRRMVTEMVAMATSDVDAWHVVAHSLGTIVAYNGLTELGHTLPNYLPQDQWGRLPYPFKHDDNCQTRPAVEMDEMMPARPAWLKYGDVVNRQLLFAKLRGVLTYGSPLDKFAALWPRIVATATDRMDGESAFAPDCTWINYYAPADPVGAHLDYFTDLAVAKAVPPVVNKRSPPGFLVGLAHVLYFNGIERFQHGFVDQQKRDVARWLSGEHPPRITSFETPKTVAGFVVGARVPIAYLSLIALLWMFSSAMVAAVGGTVKAVLGAAPTKSFTSIGKFVKGVWTVAPDLIGYLLTIVLMVGLWRWYSESRLNRKLMVSERRSPKRAPESAEIAAGKEKVEGVVGTQERVALTCLCFGVAIVGYGLLADFAYLPSWSMPWIHAGHFSGFVVAAIAIILASATQTVCNRPTMAMARLGGHDVHSGSI